MARWRNFSLAIILSALLAGCGDNPAEQQWQRYHQQLANDLALSNIQRADPGNIGDFPERSDRVIDIPETLNIWQISRSLLGLESYLLRLCLGR